MLYYFPPETFGYARSNYERPYENPIEVKAGDIVQPAIDDSRKTDFMGWTSCVGPDGRAGWTPESWCEPKKQGWRMKRDFSALELTVMAGERLHLILGESGFLYVETDTGERGWVPDAVLTLDRPLTAPV